MADEILQAIGAGLSRLGYQNIKLSTEPVVRDWDVLPGVRISPLNRPDIKWIAFNHRNVKQAYQVLYVEENSLDPSAVPSTGKSMDSFKNDLVNLYMGLNNDLMGAGAWNSRVRDQVDFDRSKLPKGYICSSMVVEVDFIQN